MTRVGYTLLVTLAATTAFAPAASAQHWRGGPGYYRGYHGVAGRPWVGPGRYAYARPGYGWRGYGWRGYGYRPYAPVGAALAAGALAGAALTAGAYGPYYGSPVYADDGLAVYSYPTYRYAYTGYYGWGGGCGWGCGGTRWAYPTYTYSYPVTYGGCGCGWSYYRSCC